MSRTFELALRPPDSVESHSLRSEFLWDIDIACRQSKSDTTHFPVEMDRKADLFLSKSASFSERDLEMIVLEIGRQHTPDPEVRSVWLDLETPIPGEFCGELGLVESVQIKGIVFDDRVSEIEYGGAGWPREIHFSDRTGVIRRYSAPKDATIGRCLLAEAVNEFDMCRKLEKVFSNVNMYVPTPIGWGFFDGRSRGGNAFGFVVLGLPALVSGRERFYLEAAESLSQTRDFSEMDYLLRMRANSIRLTNMAGYVVPGRHFGNFSLTPEGNLFLHDLGPPHSLHVSQMHSVDQFVGETFAQLVYAVTPRKLVVPVPSEEQSARKVVIDFLDQYLFSSLSEFYGSASVMKGITFDDLEATFFRAFEAPLRQIDTKTARIHCEVVRSWLE